MAPENLLDPSVDHRDLFRDLVELLLQGLYLHCVGCLHGVDSLRELFSLDGELFAVSAVRALHLGEGVAHFVRRQLDVAPVDGLERLVGGVDDKAETFVGRLANLSHLRSLPLHGLDDVYNGVVRLIAVLSYRGTQEGERRPIARRRNFLRPRFC